MSDVIVLCQSRAGRTASALPAAPSIAMLAAGRKRQDGNRAVAV